MLHELCHNSHGPHNANFYKLWDEIRKECKELMSKGIAGTEEGFDLPGRRLGGFSRQPPVSSMLHLLQLKKRARTGSLLPSGPKRLGGDNNIMVALSPIQAAAMAAERRLQDELWCASESFGGSGEVECSSDMPQEVVSKKHSAESSKCSTYSETLNSETIPWKKSHSSVPSSKVGTESNPTGVFVKASTAQSVLTYGATDSIEDKAIWECGNCTLFNPALAPICEACGSEKPQDIRTKFKIWSC